jgi:hypothetical protein
MLAELKEKFVKKKPKNTLSNIFLRKIGLECIQQKENKGKKEIRLLNSKPE